MPWMIPAAMLGTAVIGGVMANSAANKAQGAAGQSMSMQAAIANQQMELAQKQLNAQLAKQTDAQGNQVIYDEATNQWKTILSPISAQLQGASNKEQLLRLTDDANMRRRGMVANEARRQEEGRLADALQRQYQYTQSNPRDMGGEMTSAIRLSRLQGTSDANDELRRNYSKQGMRTGMGAAQMAEGLRQLGQNATNTNLSINASAPMEGSQLGAAMTNARIGDTLNQYNMLAGRASNYEDTPFSPSNIDQTLSAVMANQRLGALRGGTMASGALDSAGRSLAMGMSPMMKQDNTGANLAYGAGDILTKLLGNKGFVDWAGSSGGSANGGYSTSDASRIRNDTNAMWGDSV